MVPRPSAKPAVLTGWQSCFGSLTLSSLTWQPLLLPPVLTNPPPLPSSRVVGVMYWHRDGSSERREGGLGTPQPRSRHHARSRIPWSPKQRAATVGCAAARRHNTVWTRQSRRTSWSTSPRGGHPKTILQRRPRARSAVVDAPLSGSVPRGSCGTSFPDPTSLEYRSGVCYDGPDLPPLFVDHLRRHPWDAHALSRPRGRPPTASVYRVSYSGGVAKIFCDKENTGPDRMWALCTDSLSSAIRCGTNQLLCPA